MRVVRNILETELAAPRVVLTAGSFDGVHLGHQSLLGHVTRAARDRSGTAAVLTFSPHPRRFFAPGHALNLLTTESQKFDHMERCGVDAVCVLPFTETAAQLEPLAFLTSIVKARCHAELLVVGHDFRFGRDARGDFALLRERAEDIGVEVEEAPPLYMEGERVSSTLIREMLLQGDVEKAGRLLGRPYAMAGRVCAGRGIGAELGFPTANLCPSDAVVPAQGVYAARARVDGAPFCAAVNIGIAPTIRNEETIVEAHLLDFRGDLAEQELELVFLERIRPEMRFASREELAARIASDVEQVRGACGKHREGE